MNLYVFVNIGVIAVPLMLSFDRKVAFYRKWVPLLTSIAVVSTLFVLWDAFATSRGDWWFSEAHSGPPVLLGLPLGEILFFFAVPYACIFVYEVVKAYVSDASILSRVAVRTGAVLLSATLAVLALLFRRQEYTVLALASCSAMILLSGILAPRVFGRRVTWIYFAAAYLPFVIVNSILTSIPVVNYETQAIWGARVLSIPLEDFLYNFALLDAYLLVYLLVQWVFGRARGRSS